MKLQKLSLYVCACCVIAVSLSVGCSESGNKVIENIPAMTAEELAEEQATSEGGE